MNFIDNKDGTITDTATGLMWQQAIAPETYTWEKALVYCKNLSLGGHSDWRLPTIKELQSIADYGRYSPAINTTFFPDTKASYCWSSTTYALNTYGAWYMYFYYGYVNYNYKDYNYYVRAVRGGQSGSLGDSVISKNPLYAEIDKLRVEVKELSAEIDWLIQDKGNFMTEIDRLKAELAKAEAKLSERKAVHEWLNEIGIPSVEKPLFADDTDDYKPICLFRRLRIMLDNYLLLKAEVKRLKNRSDFSDFQSDPEKLYNWLVNLYELIDRFPDFTESNLYKTERAIVDCRELQKRCADAFNEYGMEWMVELEINFGGGSIE